MGRVHERIRVLHIDDDTSLLEVTGRLLEANDDRIAVTSLESTAAALDRLDEADCIVADYVMPERDGSELLTRVRESRPDLPVVFFTGRDTDELDPEALAGVATEHVRKGASVDQYTTLCESVVGLVEGVRDCPEAPASGPTVES